MRCASAVLLFAVAVTGTAGDDRFLAAPDTARLTATEPIAELRLGPIPDGPVIILVEIGVVRNPKRLPVSVGIALTNSAREVDPIPVSTVSLFPSDQPGSFILRATQATQALKRDLGQPNPKAVVRLTLISAGQAMQGGGLLLDEIRASWMKEP